MKDRLNIDISARALRRILKDQVIYATFMPTRKKKVLDKHIYSVGVGKSSRLLVCSLSINESIQELKHYVISAT